MPTSFERIGLHGERPLRQPHYKILVTTRNDYSDGEMRITPPIYFYPEYLEEESGTADVSIRPIMIGREATLLAFWVQEDSETYGDLPSQTRLEMTAESMMSRIGSMESERLFKD